MRKGMLVIGVAALALLMVTSASAANRGIDFIPMGFYDFGNPNILPYSAGWQITADGSYITGVPSPFGGCMSWTKETGWDVISLDNASICYISDDGSEMSSEIANANGRQVTARWDGTQWVEIDTSPFPNLPCDFNKLGNHGGISGDGSTVGGLYWDTCSYARGYTEDGSFSILEGLRDDSSRVNALNQDGSVAAGWTRIEWGGWFSTRWTNGVAEWWPGDGSGNPDIFIGETRALTSDGQMAVGDPYPYPSGLPREGWIENANGFQSTGALPWGWFNDAGLNIDLTQDGTMAVGRFGFGPFSVATIWTEATGLIDMNQFLIDQGRTEIFEGWVLNQINAVSDDGTMLTGFGGNPDNWTEGFVIDLSKVSVCHAPGGDTSKARTLMIGWNSMPDHVGHGDFLGTCEAAPLSRDASAMRMQELRNNPRARAMMSRHGSGNVTSDLLDLMPSANFWHELNGATATTPAVGAEKSAPKERTAIRR